ncbi:MAG: hypothetical protein K0U34_07265 [Alphaproteobacteria bacterium]|nr:hypothetical protein [Alphaproteobacteria bacterium]
MPTNLFKPLKRQPSQGSQAVGAKPVTGKRRQIFLVAGAQTLPLALLDTPTAARIAAALPLFAAAEPWGEALHFRLPIDSGRERGARINGRLGEVYYWTEDDRVIIPFGATPISREGEIRLPRPCNPWATVIGDVSCLQRVAPSAKVTLKV